MLQAFTYVINHGCVEISIVYFFVNGCDFLFFHLKSIALIRRAKSMYTWGYVVTYNLYMGSVI